jgi:hypothetical protein
MKCKICGHSSHVHPVGHDFEPVLAPGSIEAREQGCSCAVIDNHYGRGRGGDGTRWGWFISGDCRVHGSEL